MIFQVDLYEYFRQSKDEEHGILHAYFHEDGEARKTVLVIPGGAYGGCCFRENKPIAERLFREGFNACYLDYTCGEDAEYPVALREGGMALVFIRERLKEMGAQEEKVFILGFSAGGHLAGHISNPKRERELCPTLSEKQKSLWRVDGTAYAYPVVSSKMECIHEGSFRNLLKSAFDEKKEEVSLENLIDENSAPTFIFHCADDSVVPVENSFVLAKAYGKAGVPYQLHVFPKGGHGVALPTEECWLKTEMGMVNPELIIWWELFRKWIEKR